MPVIGFDDERVRDAWVEEEVRRAVWFAVHGEPAAGTLAAAMEEAREAIRAFVDAVVEALSLALAPLMEAIAEICEAALGQIERVWELIKGMGEGGEEKRGQSADRSPLGPRHVNCRCVPVERVDPVRAGRTRWWTRK